MYCNIESLAAELGVSTLVVQRRAVKLGIWTKEGVADEDVAKLEFLRETKVERVKKSDVVQVDAAKEVETTVEPEATEYEPFRWYGEFADGKPVYRRANEKPASKGTVASIPLCENVTPPEFKVIK